LLLGSVFPDLVDKTVGMILFRSYFQNGRIFMHTFLVTLSCLAAGNWIHRRKGDDRLRLFALGMASHLLLDQVWEEPETAFWPALGPFPRYPSLRSLWSQLAECFSTPVFWITEGGGFLLLASSFRRLGIRDRADLLRFVREGRCRPPAAA
jgi:membrane-bound metal-dependent hydrolase YbcI (DUF457 family)